MAKKLPPAPPAALAKLKIHTLTVISERDALEALEIISEDDAARVGRGIELCKQSQSAIDQHPKLAKAYRATKDAFDAVSSLRLDLKRPWMTLEKSLRDRLSLWQTAKAKRALADTAHFTTAARAGVASAMTEHAEVVSFGDEEYVFGAPDAQVTAQVEQIAVTVAATPVEGVDFRRYWKPTITDLRQLAQAWVEQRIPDDVFVLHADGTIHVQSAVDHYGANLGMAMDWPGVENDFEDRPIVGGGGARE